MGRENKFRDLSEEAKVAAATRLQATEAERSEILLWRSEVSPLSSE